MSILSWLMSAASKHSRSCKAYPRRTRLAVECLEDRCTPTAVSLVSNINPGAGGSSPFSLTNVNGTVFFSASDGINGVELWKSDGTPAGTVMVKNIHPTGDANPSSFANVNGTLYFAADDGTNGSELWKSDGTAAGTVMVKNIHPTGDSAPSALANVNGTLFFQASDGTNGFELWKSDGTEAGTVLVKNIHPTNNSGPSLLTNVNGTLFFIATDGTNGIELWKSDGTAAGTVMVKNIHPTGDSLPLDLTNVNGTLFFSANSDTSGIELWKSDGTEVGTVRVKDINPGLPNSTPRYLTNVNGTLFFTADDGTNGAELWRSDGTVSGTDMVKDIQSPGSSSPFSLTNVNGRLFFQATDTTNGSELWKSDGTEAGTVLIKNINSTGNSFPQNLTNINGTVFFQANDGTNGIELWSSGGTDASTALVKNIHPTGDSSPSVLTNVNGTLFFSANDGTNGIELWRASSFSDDFDRADSASLGANWTKISGKIAVLDGALTAIDAKAGGALNNGDTFTDVRVVAFVSVLTTGASRVDLLARASATNNGYAASLIGTDGVFRVAIRGLLNGVATTLASAPVNAPFGEGTLRFEVSGSLLKAFFNDVLVASALDTMHLSGKVGFAGTEFVACDNFFADAVTPTLPFGDSFERADGTALGSQWRETSGDLAIQGKLITARGTGANIGVYQGAAVKDVVVQAMVSMPSIGSGSAGLVARYRSSNGIPSYYLAAVSPNANGTLGAYIYRFSNGALTILSVGSVPSKSGLLRFEVVGTSLKMFFNGQCVGQVNDATLGSPGLVGVRGTARTTFDSFNAEATFPTLFYDGFNRPTDNVLGPRWRQLSGTIGTIDNVAVVKVGTSAVAVQDGISAANVVVEAAVTLLNGPPSDAGLVARVKDAKNYYYAALEVVSETYNVAIYKVVNNFKKRIGSAFPVGGGPTSKLRFALEGTSLKLFVDGVLCLNVTDTTFAAGGFAGLRGNVDATFNDFTIA